MASTLQDASGIMEDLLITHIKELVQVTDDPARWTAGKDMSTIQTLADAYVFISAGIIASYGTMGEYGSDPLPGISAGTRTEIDATGKMVFPAWCDSHTHLVFPASREVEYIDKIKGLSYEEIARRGGGILNSARKMNEIPEEQLFEDALARLEEIRNYGTGAVEIKSGYGLNTENELKMLRVIRRLKERSPLTIRATFLGAHAIPTAYKNRREEYVDLVVREMIPRVAGENLADYIDVFCDRGFFTPSDTERILEAGARYGLVPKIHANELDFSGGIQAGVRYKALSVDHLEYTGEEEIKALKNSGTMPVILPGASFFLGMPYAPARKIIDAGLPLALASDFNPGSSPSGNMQLIISLGSIACRMLPEEVIHAVTINGAYAMGVQEMLGTISRGKVANLIITKEMPSISYLPYAYGSNKADLVIINGKLS